MDCVPRSVRSLLAAAAALVGSLLVLATACIAWASTASAAGPPIVRDQLFGAGSGVASVGETVPGYREAAAMGVAPDGRILVAGEAAFGDGSAVVRFDAGGLLDHSFGAGSGYVGLPGVSGINSLAVADTGGAAVLSRRTTVTRVGPEGAIDATFGTGGSVSLPDLDPSFSSLHFWSLDALADGDLLAAGIRFNSTRMVVVRLLPDGHLDTSFGEGGLRTLGLGPNPSSGALAMAIEEDGDIVLAGYAHHDPAVARLLPDGSPDLTFGSGGVSAPHAFIGEATALALGLDGSILVAGNARRRAGKESEDLLLRFGPDGTLDRSFGTAAQRTPERGGYNVPIAVLSSHGHVFVATKDHGPALRVYGPDGREGASLAEVGGVPWNRFAGTAATLDHGDLILASTPKHRPGQGDVQVERFRVGP